MGGYTSKCEKSQNHCTLVPTDGSMVIETLSQGWAKLVLIALERYSVALKRLTFNLR
jgi:hypothetical protein